MIVERVPEPPLIDIYTDEHHYEVMTDLSNRRSIEYTGFELTTFIEEISDFLAQTTSDTRDLRNLTEAYVSGEITRLARSISEITVNESYQQPNYNLVDELTILITSNIYYKMLNIIEDSQVAITREVLSELLILLGLS